jgi:hypothetical protein
MRHVHQPEPLVTWKEAPTMSTEITYAVPSRIGGALPGARLAWTSLVGAGVQSARTQNPALAAMRPDALCAFRHVPATRKQTTNVNPTRIDAGGYGAMGPHPEREPA